MIQIITNTENTHIYIIHILFQEKYKMLSDNSLFLLDKS